MRKSLMLLIALAPLAAFAGTMAPAVAESGEGSCVSHPGAAAAAAGPLDLEKIPTKPVAGHLAIQGVAGDDECDDMGVGKSGDHRLGAAVNGDDNGIAENDD